MANNAGYGFTFNGVHSGAFLTMNSAPQPIMPPIGLNSTKVPGRAGIVVQSSEIGARKFEIAITIHEATQDAYNDVRRRVASWLSTNGPAPLVFDRESDMVYFAQLAGETGLSEVMALGQGTITFICSDPFAYELVEQTATLPSNVLNSGTAETKPKFRMTVNQPITHLEITNHSNLTPQGSPKSIVLGRPADMTQTEIEREVLVFDDTMQDKTTWQLADRVDNGYVAGEMGADAEGFYAERFGEVVQPGDKKSQGPSLKKAIGQSLQDFRLDVYFKLLNINHETGMIEVYLLDVNNNVVGKIGFEDIWKTMDLTQGKMQAGDQNTGEDIYARADYPYGWNDFSGIMRIERVNNVWEPYWAVIGSNGNHYWIKGTFSYNDIIGAYGNPITQVQVAIRKWPLTEACNMSVHRIKVFKINEPQTEDEVPYIAQAGDEIEIDTASDQPVRVNGEPVGIMALTSDLFTLVPGYNNITITSAVDAEAIFQRRFL